MMKIFYWVIFLVRKNKNKLSVFRWNRCDIRTTH